MKSYRNLDPSDREARFPRRMKFAYMEIEILAHLTTQTEQTGTHLAGMRFLKRFALTLHYCYNFVEGT
jgi:hypothetical protein